MAIGLKSQMLFLGGPVLCVLIDLGPLAFHITHTLLLLLVQGGSSVPVWECDRVSNQGYIVNHSIPRTSNYLQTR